jgi:cellulose synthase/poly-beta-1,6-N-acetylglucosamine synthase-like glycosyltransferase
MAASDAPFIAILDADFRPPADWLRKVMGYFFTDSRAGFVQSRFEFSNWNVNALTRMQGLMSDAHFVMEQDVRARAGLLFQFNGTAGVLRREAVLAARGWSDDSLAEDLDLVVRMEIAGWHGVFVMQPPVTALVPERIDDWRVQQRRWASGFAQVARKLLAAIARADWSAPRKISAMFLILYQGAFALVALALVGVLLEWALRGTLPEIAHFLSGVILVLCAVVAVGMTLPPYLVLRRGGLPRYFLTLITVPPLLLYLSLANSLPMLTAFFGRRESFKRTPKA